MAAFDGEQLSGLAGQIRRSIESDEYDLANYTESRVKELMIAAFSAPLTGPTAMIRCTFIAGGGKLVRVKYSDDLPKWILSALRDIGFTEDRSAAETYDSQSTFKQQHDTGQNLKYVIVYPRVACASSGANKVAAKDSESSASAAPLDIKTPEYMAAAAALDTFRHMATSKCESWRQKKRMLKVLQDAAEVFAAIEAKLCSGAALDAREQALYESNSGQDAEKLAWLQGEIKAMSEGGKLLASEKEELLASMQANLVAVEAEKAKAQEEGKAKLVDKLSEKVAAIAQRKTTVAEAAPHQARLRHGDEIQKLRMRLLALVALEERPKGSGAMTIADLQTLSEKPELERGVADLEKASRGWFETDEEFAGKCLHESKEAATKYKARAKAQTAKKGSGGSLGSKGGGKSGTQRIGGGSSGASYSASSSANSWATIGVKKAVAQARGGGGGATAGGFAAAFGGGDSDDDED